MFRSISRRGVGAVAVVLAVVAAASAFSPGEKKATAAKEKKVAPPKIADEPKTVDPAGLMPDKLAAKATADFSHSSLREILEWLRKERQIVALLDNNALSELGLLPSEPVSDRLDDAPIYLLLNRLRSLGLDWYQEDDVLHVTSIEAAKGHLTMQPHNIGDLLDAGFDTDSIVMCIQATIDPEGWTGSGKGQGDLSVLGDVVFVRQTREGQEQVRGFLQALRKHGRRTFTCDPSQHLALREKLEQPISVALADVPLEAAVKSVAKAAGVDIRIDARALKELSVSPRVPVSLQLNDRKLKTVLQALTADLKLTCVLRDGLLCVTGVDQAKAFVKTAVYDVRDLCRDEGETTALIEAITSGTGADHWKAGGSGEGDLHSPKPGVLVVLGDEELHSRTLDLLETYRTALRASRPRKGQTVDPNEVVTIYYRLHENVATDLVGKLPELVRPDSWRANRPDAPGTITFVASPPDFVGPDGQRISFAAKDSGKGGIAVLAQAVLVIRQTRAVHEEIVKTIRRIELGDPESKGAPPQGMGMMGGMGGFGGGFLSVPVERLKRAESAEKAE